jgi:HlyD family secretion protein
MATSRRRKRIIIFVVILLCLGTLATVAVLKKREAVIIVQAEKAAMRNLTELVKANGKIQPVLQVKISPEVSGEIIELPLKEGYKVNKGDLLLKIKPDSYLANRNQAEAGYQSSLAGESTAVANLLKAEAEFTRNKELFDRKLISDSAYIEFKTLRDVAQLQLTSSKHQVNVAKALLARAEEELAKTTIVSPLTGTISKLNSQVGERVVGTATMAGTEVMTIADLNEMEARVDIGEVDVVLISPGQKAQLEVDAFKDRKFTGVVTEVANSSKGLGALSGSSGSTQEATKFEVKIHIQEKELFRPGMSVTAEIETRYRTNVITVPIASVTTRLPKDGSSKKGGGMFARAKESKADPPSTHSSTTSTNANKDKGKGRDAPKPIEVVFVLDGSRVKMVPVKIGISDDDYWEIIEGLKDGQEIVSGGYRAISRDLEDGKKVMKGKPGQERKKEKDENESKDKEQT